VVLIHGGLGDYREWNPQIERISSHYRVVAYSRRYNYPITTPRFRRITQRLLKLGTSPHCSTRLNWSASMSSATLMAPHGAILCEGTSRAGAQFDAGGAAHLRMAARNSGRAVELDKFMDTMLRPAGKRFDEMMRRRRCGSRAIISPAKDHTIKCRRSSGNLSRTTFGNGRLSPHREMRSRR
jgi:hypothetical protein